MLLSNAIRDLTNRFREGEKMALDAEIQREIQRSFAGRAKSSERLEELVNRREQLVRQMESASLRQNPPLDICDIS
jgi:hypothetical protein